MCLKDWAKKVGMSKDTLRYRIVVAKWTVERSLTTH